MEVDTDVFPSFPDELSPKDLKEPSVSNTTEKFDPQHMESAFVMTGTGCGERTLDEVS